MEENGTLLQEVLPKSGLVYSEKGKLRETICKPKILPIKSGALQRLEQLEQRAAKGVVDPGSGQPRF